MADVFIGLGSNSGKKLENLRSAVSYLAESPEISIKKCSSIYESLPYGFTEQNNFFNAVLEINCGISLQNLFIFSKSIEKKIGRKDTFRWGPRIIDIDILFYDRQIYSDDDLIVPHPEILKRDFVYVPLLEIEPDIKHPAENKKISELTVGNTELFIIKKLEYSLINT